MNNTINKYNFFYFILFLSATGFFEKIQRIFYLPIPYLGDLISSIFPISILFFLVTFFISKKLISFDKIEIYFSLLILSFLFIYYFNSSKINYENISFLSNYIWILNCYIIYKYILNCDNTKKSDFLKIIYYSLLFLFFINFIINYVNNKFYIYEFYNEIVKRAEPTSLTAEGYILSFFFYYLFLVKFFDKENIVYFLVLASINFFAINEIESRGLWLLNFLSILYIFLILDNEKKLLFKKTIILILFLLSLYDLGITRIGSTIKSSLVGLNKDYNKSYYMNFNSEIYSNIDFLNKKNEEVLEMLDNYKKNNSSIGCENYKKNKICSKKEIVESIYSKEISYSLSSHTRFFTIKYVLEEFFKKPILGLSIREIKKITVNEDKIHSNLIILITSTGIVGFILLIIFFYFIYNQMVNKKIGLFVIFFILYFSFFFDSLMPFIGLTLLLATSGNKILKNE